MYPVRNSAKAIIIRNSKLLCIKKNDPNGYYYVLPGGGQEKNETFIETLKRECIEELGAKINVLKLKYIREYIGKNHEFKDKDDAHQVDFMFECELIEEPNILMAHHQDDGQIGIEWIDIDGSSRSRVYPKVLISRLNSNWNELYWGDVN